MCNNLHISRIIVKMSFLRYPTVAVGHAGAADHAAPERDGGLLTGGYPTGRTQSMSARFPTNMLGNSPPGIAVNLFFAGIVANIFVASPVRFRIDCAEQA